MKMNFGRKTYCRMNKNIAKNSINSSAKNYSGRTKTPILSSSGGKILPNLLPSRIIFRHDIAQIGKNFIFNCKKLYFKAFEAQLSI